MTIALIFRKTNPLFFSIERVFNAVAEEMVGQGAKVAALYAKDSGISLRNILSAFSRYGKKNADIYHVTGDLHYAVLCLPRRKTLLTIHDCVFLYQTKGIKKWVLQKLFLDWPVRRCTLVTTISEATRQDIIRHTGCPPEKIVVIPNPISGVIHYQPAVFRSEEPQLLFIGSTPNKNLNRVVHALEGISCRLHIIGEITPESLDLLQRHQIRYTQSVRLSDAEMADAYGSADIVLFPSLYEGFGLPIVEGQKAGRVVITSELDPMREVAGGAACLVDPYSVESIRAGVLKVVGDKAYRDELVSAGLQNAARFDVVTIARSYLDCYRALIGKTSIIS